MAGLGNPGPRYAGTRHNAGFLVLDALARRHGVRMGRRREAESGRWGAVRLLKPHTFMNRSGAAVQAEATRNGLPPQAILVVHDDIDLPLGRLRVKRGGGAGGQRGVQDVIARLGPDFARLKVGVGRPPEGWSAEGWVLSRFRAEEQALVDAVTEAAADAVERLVRDGVEASLAAVNAWRPPE